MTARYRIATPRTRPAALAAIDLHATGRDELDGLLRDHTAGVIQNGAIALRTLCDADTGIVARITDTHAILMPHGGPAVISAIADALDSAGVKLCDAPDPCTAFPEARSRIEALALAALSLAPSPLAVDLLLAQHDRWQGQAEREPTPRDARLCRLIDPPVIAAVGPPNVGKSTLLNALVGRRAALVADEPGTTRDHIGATIELAGLMVRWIDTPGRREAAGIEAAAIAASDAVIAGADLLIAVGDGGSPDPRSVLGREPDLVVAARSDLGAPHWPSDLHVSAATGAGLESLVAAARESLVPAADLASAEPWVFWKGDRDA